MVFEKGHKPYKGIAVDKGFADKKKKKKTKKEGKQMKNSKLGYDKRGERDGTGPHKDSFQRKSGKKIGKRQEAGEECPNDTKKGGKSKMKKMSQFKKWTYATKKSLPDSAYAVVIKKGDKKIRKLPYKDASGKVDVPHLRNALARVAQGKTDLSPSQRAAAMRKLKAVAGKYLKTYKNTKSGEIMKASISKFEVSVNDRLNAIVDVLKKRAANRKPDDEISFPVKNIASLIQDLEEIIEIKKEPDQEEDDKDTEEESDKGKKSDKEKETENEDDKEKDKDKDKDDSEDDEDEEEDKGKKKKKEDEEEPHLMKPSDLFKK